MNSKKAIENLLSEKDEEQRRKIEKMTFCIISSFKSQQSRSNLLMFTLDNSVY